MAEVFKELQSLDTSRSPSRTFRGGQRPAYGPSHAQPTMNTTCCEACTTTPLCNSIGLISHSKEMVTCCIASLGKGCSPYTIRRLIVAVVVQTFNTVRTFCRVGLRTLAHILQEVLKRIFPPRADFNASTSIAMEANALRVVAAAAHTFPSYVGRGTGHPVCGRSTQGIFNKLFPIIHSPATTGLGKIASKIRAFNHNLFAANTATKPTYSVILPLRDHMKDSEAVKYLTFDIFDSVWSFNFRHNDAPRLADIHCSKLTTNVGGA